MIENGKGPTFEDVLEIVRAAAAKGKNLFVRVREDSTAAEPLLTHEEVEGILEEAIK